MRFYDFVALLRSQSGVFLTDHLILFRNLELYDTRSDHSITFADVAQLAAYPMNGGTLEKYVAGQEDFCKPLNGGRGASPLSGKMGGGFTSANARGDRVVGKALFPASFNTGGRFRSVAKVLKSFQRKYASADREYGVAVDPDGFVHRHVEGGRSSVRIRGTRGQTILHNHPSGGHFSKADMQVIAIGPEKSIVAVGKINTYSLAKGKHFDPNGFVKAINNAKWPVEYDYDKGADWWLRRNAMNYGYTYSRSRTKR